MEFKAIRGADYTWSPADTMGLKRILGVEVEEFRARARRGLQAIGFLRSSTVAKLTSGEAWNGLAGEGSGSGKRRVIAEVGTFDREFTSEDYFGSALADSPRRRE